MGRGPRGCPRLICPSMVDSSREWLTGWKPSTSFRLVNSLRRQTRTSLPNLTEDQVNKIEKLRVRIRLEEEVQREMEKHQVGIADRRMVKLARVATRARSGGGDAEAVARVDGLVEVALKNLLGGLEKVMMKMADCVRLKTRKGLLDVLSPIESVDFLAGMARMQIQMRRWGEKRESSSRGHERERDRGSCNCAVCLGSNNN